MESTSWLDVVVKRLRFFMRPVPLASTIGALLLGVFIWDYLRHPEWFGAFEGESVGPNEELDLSGLTPEEQAAATDLDNLTLLLNELGVESGNSPQTQALPTGDLTEQNSFLNETLALSQPNAASPQPGASPFSGYLQQYEFGRNSLRSSGGTSSTGSQFGAVNFNYFGRTNGDTMATSDQPINPLAEALSNQAGLAGAVQTQEDSPLANELRSQSDPSQDASQATADGTTQDTLPPGEFSSQTVTIPGVGFPVLPTLPQMSPPPGTTGYTAPATLDLMPPLPGSSSSSSTFPGAASPLPSAGVSGATAGTGLPSTSSSDVDVSNGFVTPYTPVVPTVTPAQGTTTQPFTAPRPPGTYTGGGYINTFSNPSGPSSTAPNGN